MTAREYGARGRRRDDPPIAQDIRPWPPIAGYYRGRLNRDGPWLAIRIWHGPPLDPWDGTELDRAPRWQATRGGVLVEVDQLWPFCANFPIWESEYRYLSAVRAHALQHDQSQPEARPHQPVDLLTMQPVF